MPVSVSRHPSVCAMRLGRVLFAVCASLPLTALAQDFLNTIPSTRYLLLRAPFSPTSPAECDTLSREFQEEVQRLSAQHGACLKDAPGDDGSSGSCSKSSCQAVHSALYEAGRRSRDEVSTCQTRLANYQAEQRQIEERRRRAAAEEARAEAERVQRDEARRRERDRQDAEAARRDREWRETQDRRDHDDRVERERQARESAARERQANTEKAAREKADAERKARENAQQQAALAYALAQQEYQRQVAAAEAAQALAVRREKEAKDYLEMVQRVKSAKDSASDLGAFAGNPFRALGDKAVDALASGMVGTAVDAAVPIGPEGRDRRYDTVAALTDEARSSALGANPFAAKISSLAAEGVQKIHRKVLGEAQGLEAKFDAFSETPSGQSVAAPPANRPVPAPTGTSNPFRKEQTTTSTGPVPPTRDANGRSSGLADAAIRPSPGTVTSRASPGQTFYRQTADAPLAQLAENDVPANAEGDRIENGIVKCSKTGVGRVLPECERRRKNPFTQK